ncbi:MAG TPA: 50S ribosomal protein L25 [Gammaproteobacteria bacterium]|nr:50S ribosomal protein L25 [Gammaproteobacteria bacterium]
MSVDFELSSTIRQETGTAAMRRLRRESLVPGVLYGGTDPVVNIQLQENELNKALENEAIFSHILDLKVDGKNHKALLKDLHRHPYKPRILHVDFQRVSANQKLHVQVPIHFLGEEVAPGVKQGGLVSHLMTAVQIECQAKDLPEFLEVDISALDLGSSLHLSDISVPTGVTIPELGHGPEHDLPIISITVKRGGDESEEIAAEEPEAAEGSAEES